MEHIDKINFIYSLWGIYNIYVLWGIYNTTPDDNANTHRKLGQVSLGVVFPNI